VFIRTQRLFGARRLFIKSIFQPFVFLLSVLDVYWIINQISTKNVKKMWKKYHQLCLISVNLKQKNITDRSSGTLLNVRYISPWNTVEVYRRLLDRKRTVQSNLELRKAKLCNDSRNAEETLEMILACRTSRQKSYNVLKETGHDTIPDTSFVSSISVRSRIVNGLLGLIISG